MNIFVLDTNPKISAQYHVDKHCVKMILESAQLLCSAHWMNGSPAPYKVSHKNHPCSLWTRECIENYNWLLELAFELCKEYTYRYGKIHKTEAILEWLSENKPNLKSNGNITQFRLAMPDECKKSNVVDSYRNYYMKEKSHIAIWTKREQPNWFVFNTL